MRHTAGVPDAASVLVLDSASLYYRAFHALPESMTAPDGHPHNAIRGFLSTLTRLVDAHHPTAIVAAWDADWRPQWRVDLVPTYKTHRVAEDDAEAEPETLGPQVDGLADLLDALGVARWGVADHEADDVIASVCRQSATACIVVSGDRDLVQLVDDRTRLLLTVNGGMEKWPLLDGPAVAERFGVPPSRYVDLAVLRGDPSDGLPGVRGIGGKTAAALVTAYGGVEQVLARAASHPAERPMTPRLASALLADPDAVRAAHEVATAVTTLTLPGPIPSRLPTPTDPDRVMSLASEWGVTRQVADLQRSLAR